MMQVQLAMNTNFTQKFVIPMTNTSDVTSQSDKCTFFAVAGGRGDSVPCPINILIGNIFGFHGQLLDETLAGIIFALGPGE